MAESPSLEDLIQAAQNLESNCSEEESSNKRNGRSRQSKKSTPYRRSSHNLLEKNRRAQLRDSLEVLRQHVPFPDNIKLFCSKRTTLALLQSAKHYIETLQQKEREENEIKMKLEQEHSLLLAKLVELGAAGFVNSATSPSSPPPPGTTPTEIACPMEDLLELNERHFHEISPAFKELVSSEGEGLEEDDDNVVIDVISEEDDNSSTTSGSDGGCTSTSHKFPVVPVLMPPFTLPPDFS